MTSYMLQGKNVLITAGPTREPLDPIRYISNHTGGKWGYDIAAFMLEQGARVFLISGPAKIEIAHPSLTVVKVNTAAEMYLACCKFFEAADIALFAASVSDYRPKVISDKKISNCEESLTIKMVKNIDVAAAFAKYKRNNQLTVGISTEVHHDVRLAISKMERKNLDMVVLNTIAPEYETEKFDLKNLSILKSDYSVNQLQVKSKSGAVKEIVSAIAELHSQKQNSIYHQFTTVTTHRSLMA